MHGDNFDKGRTLIMPE